MTAQFIRRALVAICLVVWLAMIPSARDVLQSKMRCLPMIDMPTPAMLWYTAVMWPLMAIINGVGMVLVGEAGVYACDGHLSKPLR